MTCDDECCSADECFCDFPNTGLFPGRLFVCSRCGGRYEAVSARLSWANAPRMLQIHKDVKIIWRSLK